MSGFARTAAIGAGAIALGLAGAALVAPAQPRAAPAAACPGDNGGLTLSPGFCATVFADDLGHVRHMALGPKGVIYANTWSGRYFPGAGPKGAFLIALRDTSGAGKANTIARFGQTAEEGSAGGSGVAVYGGFVYAEMNDKIVRYRLPPGQIVPAGKPEVVLSGLPLDGDHPMHPFVIDANGKIYVDVATATNSCQSKNRQPNVPGEDPCTELKTRGGIWSYDADKLGQTFSPAGRYATGIRNGEGMAWDADGRMYVTQHGRDQLLQNWPQFYPDAKKTTELPSEQMMQLKAGGDYGWPYCYYDPFQKKLVLAPEYGGDGGKKIGVCASKTPPVAAFPAHWAPNDLTVYKGTAFPAPYRGGAFIAFHGSWNRAPEPQGGFNVVYQPLKGGKASGAYIVFADGFAGAGKASGNADFRPTGLLVGSDGALYISDDNHGRIWKVTYQGPANVTAVAAAPEPRMAAATPPPAAPAPTVRAIPPGSSAEQVAEGERVYKSSTCGGCHGADAKGSAVGPDLTSGSWLWGDGGLASISDTIAKGVPAPKKYRSPMPPMGGAQLSPADLSAVSAYVWSVGHTGK